MYLVMYKMAFPQPHHKNSELDPQDCLDECIDPDVQI